MPTLISSLSQCHGNPQGPTKHRMEKQGSTGTRCLGHWYSVEGVHTILLLASFHHECERGLGSVVNVDRLSQQGPGKISVGSCH